MDMILLLSLHFLADFILQSREMGTKKSTEPMMLAKHMGIQALIFFLGLSFIDPKIAIVFALFNAAIHGFIDWNIWKLYKLSILYRKFDKSVPWEDRPALVNENYRYYEDHLFYTTIGLDQLLHGITLILLYEVLYVH